MSLTNTKKNTSYSPSRELSSLSMKSGSTADPIYIALLDNYGQIVPDLD